MNAKSLESFYDKSISDIVEGFDYEKVKKVMDCLEWEWGGGDKIPTIDEIEEVSIRLLRRAVSENISQCATGGFVVTKDGHYLTLSFNVENTDNVSMVEVLEDIMGEKEDES